MLHWGMTKKDEHEQAQELRRRGHSMKDIARILGVSVGSVHLWVKDTPLRPEDEIRLRERGRGGFNDFVRQRSAAVKTSRKVDDIASAQREAEDEWENRKLDPIFIFGLALYIGEGGKAGSDIAVTNTNPAVLRASLCFFTTIGADMGRVTARITLHQGEHPEEARQYWSKEIGIAPEKFGRVTPSKVSGGKRARHLIHGTVTVRVGHAHIRRKLNRWMELAAQEFGQKCESQHRPGSVTELV